MVSNKSVCVCVVNISHATVMRTLCIYSVGACRITEQTLEILSGEGGKKSFKALGNDCAL